MVHHLAGTGVAAPAPPRHAREERSSLANLEMYGGEEEFISQQIRPNLPLRSESGLQIVNLFLFTSLAALNCSGLTQLQTIHSANQTAIVGFFGSGSHLMRMMLELSTGLKSSSQRTADGLTTVPRIAIITASCRRMFCDVHPPRPPGHQPAESPARPAQPPQVGREGGAACEEPPGCAGQLVPAPGGGSA